MSDTESTVAVLYADISNSMTLFQALGDVRAREVIRLLFEGLQQRVSDQDGRVVKFIGDEVMCAFPSAECAALAALAMQRYVSESRTEPSLSLRIGFHCGPVVPEGDDLFGHTVNLAARVAGQSSADRILTTLESYEQLSRPLRASAFPFRTTAVKGVEAPIELYELVWCSDATEMDDSARSDSSPQRPTSERLRLIVQGHEHVLESGQPPLTIGRKKANRLVIADTRVSGNHAKIELRGGSFVLTDDSRNGTFVAFDGEVRFFKTGRELVLRQSGRLWFGREPDDPEGICVRYFVK